MSRHIEVTTTITLNAPHSLSREQLSGFLDQLLRKGLKPPNSIQVDAVNVLAINDPLSILAKAPDIEALLNSFRMIGSTWCVKDVHEVRPDLNDEQAFQVLTFAQGTHDATLGISWEILEQASETLFGAPQPIGERS